MNKVDVSNVDSPKQTTQIDRIMGKRLREARERVGISQAALGKKLGVTFQQVQKYEKAKSRISAARLFQISKILDFPIGQFYEGL